MTAFDVIGLVLASIIILLLLLEIIHGEILYHRDKRIQDEQDECVKKMTEHFEHLINEEDDEDKDVKKTN